MVKVFANFESLSAKEKIRVIAKGKALAKKDDKKLMKVLEERRLEASKIYVLGLKDFIDRKSKAIKMKI